MLEKLHMEDKYSRTEMQAAVLNAILAAVITSPMDHSVLAEVIGDGGTVEGWAAYQAGRNEEGTNKNITLGGVRVPRLYPGENLSFQTAARPAAGFADFEGAVLRNIASGLGISYEQLAGDWSKTNYSSARAALIEIWRGWSQKRVAFAQRFAQPFFMAWMEEEVDAGRLRLPRGAPEFRAHWPAYARAKWIGPGKGFVDPVKEVTASAMRGAWLLDPRGRGGRAHRRGFRRQPRADQARNGDAARGCFAPDEREFRKADRPRRRPQGRPAARQLRVRT